MNVQKIPVITVDGPSASGKGVISKMLSQKLGWHLLDSGSIYRVLAFAAIDRGVDIADQEKLADLALTLDVEFKDEITLFGQVITNDIRTEKLGNITSQIAVYPKVRESLLARQRSFQVAPGLVADGRDMGTVVFPQANFKFFIDASPKERAKRRYLQLKSMGYDVNLNELEKEVVLRDTRDRNRACAPLVPAKDAVVIDTTELSIQEVFEKILNLLEFKIK